MAQLTLKRIEDLTNNIAPMWTNIHLFPRGNPQFVDQSLRGDVRFARRQGNYLPVITTENQVKLAESVAAGVRTIKVSRLLDDMKVPDNVLSIGHLEKMVISDVNTLTGEITLDSPLVAAHTVGENVILYATPVECIGGANKGDTTLQIRAPFKVFNGDRLFILTNPNLILSGTEYQINQTQSLGTSGYNYNYQITLEQPIPRDLAIGEYTYFRTLTGYGSQVLQIPAEATQFGPFVVDYISGPLVTGLTINETLSLQLYNPIGDPLSGYSNPVTVQKNYPITTVSINNESMLFWDLIAGTIQMNQANQVLLQTNSDGHFALSTELVPEFPAGSEWEIPVQSTETCLFRVKFEPNNYRDFSLIGNVNHRLKVGTTSREKNARRIEVVIKGPPNLTVYVRNWLALNPMFSLKYAIVSDAEGNSWQSSSLMIKPYFMSAADISARYGYSNYNSGAVHF